MHFTISEQHTELFKKEEATAVAKIAANTDTAFEITYSYQKSATDTLAVNLDDTLFGRKMGVSCSVREDMAP